MAFRKPFRAVPVRPARRFKAQRRKREWKSVALLISSATTVGLVVGTTSVGAHPGWRTIEVAVTFTNDKADAISQLLLSMLGAVYQFERTVLLERQPVPKRRELQRQPVHEELLCLQTPASKEPCRFQLRFHRYSEWKS